MKYHLKGLFMVRPAKFGFNPETASTNSFQIANLQDVQEAALREFDIAVEQFRNAGFKVELVNDNPGFPLPDSIFPNNWFSTHEGGKLILYPMYSESRRAERKQEHIDALISRYNYNRIVNFTGYETQNKFLESTGSIVFDHDLHLAYACISPRTDTDVLLEVCGELEYLPFLFSAFDRNNSAVYHTNVVMSVGPDIAVCCFDSIHDVDDRVGLHTLLNKSGKTVMPISLAQMESFAGNMLFLKNQNGKQFVAVSATAWDSLSNDQKTTLGNNYEPIIVRIPTIERHGGGSIRCMLAELY